MKTNTVTGLIGNIDMRIIGMLAKKVPSNGTIVEVGSFLGKSTVTWAENCDPSVTVYAIDTFTNFDVDISSLVNHDGSDIGSFEEVFKKNTKPYDNIIMVKGESPYDMNDWDKKIDLVFLDASHTDEKNITDDLHFWDKHLSENGILCGHDFKVHGSGDDPNTLKSSDDLYSVIKCVKDYAMHTNSTITLFGNKGFWIINKGRLNVLYE